MPLQIVSKNQLFFYLNLRAYSRTNLITVRLWQLIANTYYVQKMKLDHHGCDF